MIWIRTIIIQITILRLFLLCLLSNVILGCQTTENFFGSKNKIVVVLVDVSESIPDEDWQIYERSFEALLNPNQGVVKPGNRLVLARISGQTLSGFIPDADELFPKTGIKLNDDESALQVAKKLRERFQQLRRRQSRYTNIFESLKIAEDIFKRDQKREVRWLVILSDMVEESDNYNFNTNPPTQSIANEIIEDHKNSRFLPTLSGVKVFVIGAGGGRNYQMIKEFWLRYFKEAGAICDESTYGRSPITEFR